MGARRRPSGSREPCLKKRGSESAWLRSHASSKGERRRTAIAVAAREEQEGDDVERLLADWRREGMSDEARHAGGGWERALQAAAAKQEGRLTGVSAHLGRCVGGGEKRELCGRCGGEKAALLLRTRQEGGPARARTRRRELRAGRRRACMPQRGASAEIASARISAAGPALLTPRLHLSSSLSCTSNARAAPETVLMADSQSVLQSEQFAAR